jgi:hypothetical protein
VEPAKDIPGGYCAKKHANLKDTIAKPGDLSAALGGSIRVMACHETTGGKEAPCVGWLVNQLGAGNNIALRIMVAGDPRYHGWCCLQTVGEQHERFEDTLPDE